MSKMYLTHYTEYPIFEPAEGGYYYTGAEADTCIEITDIFDMTTTEILNAAAEYLAGEIDGYKRNENGFYRNGDFWVLEVECGANTRGKIAYC